MLFRSNDTATTEIYTPLYTLSLHDALPIWWKIVMDTHVAQFHQGMQTNLRYYGGDDPDAWIKQAGERIKDEVPKRHSAMWCARLDACEMIPMGGI